MDVVVVLQLGATLGAAQNLTMGILLGTFIALAILTLFFFRSGHERAHRRQLLRELRREELQHQRSEQLEAFHDQPPLEEGLTR